MQLSVSPARAALRLQKLFDIIPHAITWSCIFAAIAIYYRLFVMWLENGIGGLALVIPLFAAYGLYSYMPSTESPGWRALQAAVCIGLMATVAFMVSNGFRIQPEAGYFRVGPGSIVVPDGDSIRSGPFWPSSVRVPNTWNVRVPMGIERGDDSSDRFLEASVSVKLVPEKLPRRITHLLYSRWDGTSIGTAGLQMALREILTPLVRDHVRAHPKLTGAKLKTGTEWIEDARITNYAVSIVYPK